MFLLVFISSTQSNDDDDWSDADRISSVDVEDCSIFVVFFLISFVFWFEVASKLFELFELLFEKDDEDESELEYWFKDEFENDV